MTKSALEIAREALETAYIGTAEDRVRQLAKTLSDICAALSQPAADERETATCRVDYLRANFTPFYLLANARGLASAEYRRAQNWVLAMRLFAVGRTSAWAICEEAGVDPDAIEVRRALKKGGENSA